MKFNTSLEKEYYYSITEAIENDSFKNKLWKENKEYLKQLKENLFLLYDIDKLYLINEFFEKNSLNENISILIEVNNLDLDDLIEEDFSSFDNDLIDYYFRTKDNTYKLYNKNLQETSLEIKKICELNQI